MTEMDLIRYAGSFPLGSQDLVQNVEEGKAFFSEIYYWYKSKLADYLLTIPFKNLKFDDLYERYRNLFLREQEKLVNMSYPTTFDYLDGHFKMVVYDPIFSQFIEHIAEVDQDRTYFTNYVKKRHWKVTDQFWKYLQEHGEIHVSEIQSSYAEKFIPMAFVEKCHLKIVYLKN